jgi:hypothetical protein
MDLVHLGGMMTAAVRLGNEAMLTLSFSAGLALRMAISDAAGVSGELFKTAGSLLAAFNVIWDAEPHMTARARSDVGACGGGPLRALFGETAAGAVALALKAYFLILPLASTVLWASATLRRLRGGFRGGEGRAPLLGSLLMLMVSALNCLLLLQFQLNGVNGALPTLWFISIMAAPVESLLCTYDSGGRLNTLINIILFLLL